jgi:hypothetical protein
MKKYLEYSGLHGLQFSIFCFEVWSYGIVEVATAVLGLENRDIHMHRNPKIYTCFCANPSLANQKQPI